MIRSHLAIVLLLSACVPAVSLDNAPCPCTDAFYCCPSSSTCASHDDPQCWSKLPLTQLRVQQHLQLGVTRAVAVDANRVFVAVDNLGIQVFTRAPTLAAASITLATQATKVRALSVQNATLLITTDDNAVDIIDMAVDTRRATVHSPDKSLHVALIDTIAYVADARAGVSMLDISQATAPQRLGLVASRGVVVRDGVALVSASHQTYIAGTHAFIADGDGGVHIMDVTDAAAPMHVSRYPENPYSHATRAVGVWADSNYLYIADTLAGLSIADIRQPAAPRAVSTLPGIAYTQVVVHAPYAFAAAPAGWLHVVDIGEPTLPKLVSALDTHGEVLNLASDDEHLYIAAGSTGLWVIDYAGATL